MELVLLPVLLLLGLATALDGGGDDGRDGAGDDRIEVTSAVTVNAGAGNDFVWVDFGSAATATSEVTLGAGNDTLITNYSYDTDMVVADFNLQQDRIGLVMAGLDADDLADQVSYAWNPSLNATVVTIAGDVRLVFTGVQAGFGPGSIQLYANDAAVRAGTPYGTL